MKVVDASLVVEALVDASSRGDTARLLLAGPLIAPSHIDVEVVNALRNLERGRVVSAEAAAVFVSSFARFPLTRSPVIPLFDRMWELRHNATPYDASYVALAEALGAPLVTADEKFSNIPGRRCEVELLNAA